MYTSKFWLSHVFVVTSQDRPQPLWEHCTYLTNPEPVCGVDGLPEMIFGIIYALTSSAFVLRWAKVQEVRVYPCEIAYSELCCANSKKNFFFKFLKLMSCRNPYFITEVAVFNDTETSMFMSHPWIIYAKNPVGWASAPRSEIPLA